LQGTGDPWRFDCDPYPPRPLTSAGMARAAPIFVPNVSNFIVEFAGDFLRQDESDGSVISAQETDGKVDFVVIGTGNDARRQIRWYGLPRDANGDGLATGVASPDVQPVTTLLQSSGRPGGIDHLPFEREYSNNHYTCVWRNGAPAMVRVLMKIEDPANHVRDGQWCEYVFNVGP
jgi:hypothetical protein